MDLLQKALTEALTRNSSEHERWTQYLQDHQQATESLEHFRKSIDVEIMVPVGTKALLPGKLYHTNEILLSHSSQIYSKCTSHQAQQVCQHRIGVARQRLDDLATERNLYQNKLDLPAAQDAFTAPGEKEIIEEYNEEDERRWREEHHVKMRRHKQAEREEREKILASKDVNVIDLLDELELMEELDFELDHLEIDSDEKLQKLISGEIPLPSDKQRKAHVAGNAAGDQPKGVDLALGKGELSNKEQSVLPVNVDANSNEEASTEEEETDSDSDDEDLPYEFQAYRSEAENMPRAEKQQFYKKKLQEVQSRLSTSKSNTFEDYVRKTDQMFLCDHLQSEIDRLQDAHQENGDTKGDAEPKKVHSKKSKKPINSTQRSVSFGENEVTSFDKSQAPQKVSEDLKNKANVNQSTGLNPSKTVHPTDEQTLEKDRVLDYVQKVASLNVEEVKAAMNARHQEQMRLKAETESKSILKNKEAVERERRPPVETIPGEKQDTNKSAIKPTEEFNQIMGEIFEKIYPKEDAAVNHVIVPDPLPGGQLRDAHAPKARVSRFKASREKQ